MCGRRLTKRRMLEIDHYYEIDQVEDLEIWKREYNITSRGMAPGVSESGGKRSLTGQPSIDVQRPSRNRD